MSAIYDRLREASDAEDRVTENALLLVYRLHRSDRESLRRSAAALRALGSDFALQSGERKLLRALARLVARQSREFAS